MGRFQKMYMLRRSTLSQPMAVTAFAVLVCVSRAIAASAEILRGLDDAGAEALLPEAIHRHPCRQWMIRSNQPLGETQAVARGLVGHWRQERRDAALDLVTFLIVFAAR